MSACALIALCLVSGQGCLCFVHSLDAPPKEQVIVGENVPAPSRSRVHIFLLQGLDPLDLANVDGLTEYIQQLGYLKTHYGQFFHEWSFRKQIRNIHKEDPQARFVVIGFSLGSYMASDLVNAIKKDGIPVDLLVYVGGFILDNTPKTQPENASHIANILTAGYVIHGPQMDRAENIRCTDVWHFGLPTHPQTRALLARELAVVAARVPFVEHVPALPPKLEEEIPRPRRVPPDQLKEMSSHLPTEWNFLNSRSAKGEPLPPPLAQPPEKPAVQRIPFAIIP